MFKNIFVVAFRNLWRNKTFSAINILGLSIGISAALVIFLIAEYEFSYDRFVKHKDRVYRVVLHAKINGTEGHSAGIQAPLAAAMQREVTGVELVVPVMQFQGDASAKVSIERTNNRQPLLFKSQPGIIFTNPQYFTLLSYDWLAGSAGSSMQDPFRVVLTEKRAKQYFSSLPFSEIIGRRITYNNDLSVTVAGIVKDLNENSSFTAEEFISYATISQTALQHNFMMNRWDDWMAYSQLYVKLVEANQPLQVKSQLKTLLAKYYKDGNKNPDNNVSFNLQPLSDVHFNSLYTGVGQRLANKTTLYSLLLLAAFLVLLACINFINLTTANAAQRAKEIGIRKTMGSSRKQLVAQFLGETFALTLLAAIISSVLAPILLKAFADFIPEGLVFNPMDQPAFFLFLLLLVIVVSFFAGLYPALILSGYKPVLVLKTQSALNTGETRNAWVRKVLTVSQFVVAQFFVIVTLMVGKQIQHSLNVDPGFNKDGVITFNTPFDTVNTRGQDLLNRINAIPEIEIASRGFLSPADEGVAFTNVSYPNKPDIKANVQIRWGDPNYLNVYKLKLLAGRNVASSDTARESLINEKYARLLGFKTPEKAIGERLRFNDKDLPIVGVIQDFLDQSTHAPVSPLVFTGTTGSTFHLRLARTESAATWEQAITKCRKAFKQVYPEADFDYRFFDETIAGFYKKERDTATLLSWVTGLSILISCIGLLGLVLYTSHSRAKEISIRKILGATIASVVVILSKDFVRLVVIAFFIAAPVAWFAVHQWLQDFEYRTEISWWIFIVSGAAILLMAVLTLSAQTVKAALKNPVKTLRTD